MQFSKVFLMNICVLTTMVYVAMLLHKYWFNEASGLFKYAFSVLLAIGAGWATMVFGLQLTDNIIFDLRFVPLLICTLAYSSPVTIFVIGLGIGLARLTFGLQQAAWAGFWNMVLLGLVCMLLNIWLRNKPWSFVRKITIVIVIVNVMNFLDIAVLGVIPFQVYMSTIVPVALPLSLGLSAFFVFILRDFQIERYRVVEIQNTNAALQRQTDRLMEAHKELEDQAKQLLLASQYKSEFLANMSHELRTPLNSIIALSGLIGDRDKQASPAEAVEYAGIIHTSGQELLRLIDDVLDLSKVEAGKMEITVETVILSEIAYALEHQFRHVAEQKGLDFVTEEAEGLPDVIYSDALRLQQIIRNLLSNALKFTVSGRVTLRMEHVVLEHEGKQEEWIAFRVKDTGIGIPEEMQSAIFEAFRQADGSISRRFGGTGLGLSISRALAQLLGGFLELQSKEGEGSQFTLYVPLRRTEG
ncbi:sensor histidine kinase [Paenibacillus rigui]|uniref:Circadian input-output histidine kinase CikA n=2 Tax=Paenibacillus rigui TaxID=554312 RepID=A0A229UN57_9BACL|nr:ATP-binding protein [Paenibacillus rigui]OXM84886.1 sensor histidine kinase [Paenibacillus rigui]